MQSAILKNNVRILTASEYELIRVNMKPHHRLIIDGLLFSGMRIEEFWSTLDDKESIDVGRGYIAIKKVCIRKKKSIYSTSGRDIPLSHFGTRAWTDLYDAYKRKEVKRISNVALGTALARACVRAGISETGIMPKSLRKTWVSWLMAIYPNDGLRIAAGIGHSADIMTKHYLNLPFSQDERDKIRPYVSGWGGNV